MQYSLIERPYNFSQTASHSTANTNQPKLTALQQYFFKSHFSFLFDQKATRLENFQNYWSHRYEFLKNKNDHKEGSRHQDQKMKIITSSFQASPPLGGLGAFCIYTKQLTYRLQCYKIIRGVNSLFLSLC